MRLPALAATLKAIAAGGAKAFYEGAIAADIAATVQAAGGSLAAEDLARHHGDVVDADLDELSRARCGRTAAERAGTDRAGAAQHPRAVRSRQARSDRARSGCTSRSKPRGSRSACATRISPIPPIMREPVAGLLDKGFAKKLAKLLDPDKRVPLPKAPTPGQRHDLSDGGRPRPHRGVADQFALQRVRHRHLHREDRHHAAQSRHRLRGRAGPSERDRARQAADAHHHSGACDARRALRDAVRRDGRGLSADGPRARHHQHGRLRHGRAGGDRSSAHVL